MRDDLRSVRPTTAAIPSDALTQSEATALDAAEQVIQTGMRTFVKVGDALMKIRDRRLYRTTYPTFENYCQQRWGLGRNYVNKVIAATEIATTIAAAVGTGVPIPSTERQARALSPLRVQPEAVAAAWTDAVERASGNQPSAAGVREAVRRLNEISDDAEISQPPAPRPRRRRPLPDAVRDAVYQLRKAAEQVERLTNDDRFPAHREDLVGRHRADFEHIGGILGVVATTVRSVKR